MSYDRILIYGDSYSAQEGCDGPVWADYITDKTGIPTINQAFMGSSNQRITRSTLEYLDLLDGAENPLVIIGWSFIRRIEIWHYGLGLEHRMPDRLGGDDVSKPRMCTLEWLLPPYEDLATMEQKALLPDPKEVHKALTDFYTSVYMLAHTLEAKGIDYLFFSGANNTDITLQAFPYVTGLSQVQWCDRNPKFYQMHDFCVQDWALANDPECTAVTNHLSTQGHEKFSAFLLDLFLEKG